MHDIDNFPLYKQRIYALENAMLLQDISIPVYFSKYNAELETVVSDLSRISLDEAADTKQAGKRESALESLINSVSANGYQVNNVVEQSSQRTSF